MLNTTINKESRSIKTIVRIGEDKALQLSTHHNKERKHYLVSIARVIIRDGFTRLSPMEDMEIIRAIPTNRYSFKAMEKEHQSLEFLLEDIDWQNWATEISADI